MTPAPSPGADPILLAAWVRARARARGTSPPVADHGGWRVDTDLPHERARHVFARVGAGLADLAATIDTPLVFLKVCDTADALRALLPTRWVIQPPAYMMTCHGAMTRAAAVAPGYAVDLDRQADVTIARITAADDALAASGRTAVDGDIRIYDQIVTSADHRRRGLGGAVMRTLEASGDPPTMQVLMATDDGRALYTTLGWTVIAPYTTAVIPEGA